MKKAVLAAALSAAVLFPVFGDYYGFFYYFSKENREAVFLPIYNFGSETMSEDKIVFYRDQMAKDVGTSFDGIKYGEIWAGASPVLYQMSDIMKRAIETFNQMRAEGYRIYFPGQNGTPSISPVFPVKQAHSWGDKVAQPYGTRYVQQSQKKAPAYVPPNTYQPPKTTAPYIPQDGPIFGRRVN